jgi:hypothetical protein
MSRVAGRMVWASDFCRYCVRTCGLFEMVQYTGHHVLWQHRGNHRSRKLLTLSAASQQKSSVPTGRGSRSTCLQRLQHKSRCQPANQQDGVAQRHTKRDQGWIPSSEAPCMCAVCRHGTCCQTIDERPVEQPEQEVFPESESCRCYCCNAKTVPTSRRYCS